MIYWLRGEGPILRGWWRDKTNIFPATQRSGWCGWAIAMSDLHCTAKQIATWCRKPLSGHAPLEASWFGLKQWKHISGHRYEMWLVVSLVDSTIKLSRRNCFVFVPRQSNCSPWSQRQRKRLASRLATPIILSLPLHLVWTLLPLLLFLHCPPLPLSTLRTIMPALRTRDTQARCMFFPLLSPEQSYRQNDLFLQH